ncbi:hypothetical protein ACAG25_07565 [Mycobacterium sp. pV006]|uniref:hypothetical protein n=1 Tax=Mycobacterium sp. pV006 TaxID=3238983 RepID=UPI00351BA1F9
MVGPQHGQPNAARYLITATVIVLVIGYGMALLATREQWSGSGDTAATAVTFAAAAPDGAQPTPEELAATADVLTRRVEALKLRGASVTADGDTVTVTAPGDGAEITRIAGARGQLVLRPVLLSLPAVPVPPTSASPSKASDEAELRQNTDGTMQALALQFHSSRCGQPDGLAGADDPDLPLITCARDDTEVFLLDSATATGDQLTDPTIAADGGGYAVELKSTATTAGDELAAVLDTEVIGPAQTPQTGAVRITGLSEQDARELRAILAGGQSPLTLTVEDSVPTTLTGRSAVRTGLIVAGALVGLAVLGTVIYLVVTRRRVTPRM